MCYYLFGCKNEHKFIGFKRQVRSFVSVAAALAGIAPPISKPNVAGTTPAIPSPQPTAAQVPSTMSAMMAVTEQLNNIPAPGGVAAAAAASTNKLVPTPSSNPLTAANPHLESVIGAGTANGTSRGASPKLSVTPTPNNGAADLQVTSSQTANGDGC